jgi:uncharacterized protein (UPF0218 family)|tara:strand:- start:731 stop:946 length:216 start_codon:yes stop_codon:yes gene_type:complete
MNYKVTYAIDSLDTKPVIKTFDEHYDMEEWITEEVQHRIDYTVQHSPYTISEEEYKEIEEYEYSLVRIEEI